jgi:alpha-1,3-rhamnosyl/mannosyltransferase
MACGTPVIISDASSLPEVGGSAAITVSPHDVEQWREALIRANEDDAWRRSASEQGIVEAGRYSWHETARQTVMSYNRALR